MTLDSYLSYPDKRLAARAAVGTAIVKGTSRFLRSRVPPSLRDLSDLVGCLHGDGLRMLEDIPRLAGTLPVRAQRELVTEYKELEAELAERYREHQLRFPPYWSVEEETALLLYVLVRQRRPSVVIEIGTGNGHSSFFILRALLQNEAGSLYSFDIEPLAGGLLSETERRAWHFRLVDRKRAPSSLADQLAKLPTADFCLHDAGHGYLPQYLEFTLLWQKLAEDGVLMCDDVDASYALIDFCHSARVRPEILIDARKAVALVARRGRQ